MKKIKFSGTPDKILIVKPSSLGDVVHSLPFLNAVRSCFPKAEIHWVIAKGLEGLLENHPMVDKLKVIDKDSWKRISRSLTTAGELKRLFLDLKREKYDLVVDLQGLLRSGVITLSTLAPVRVGFSEAREGSRAFYNVRVEGGKNRHAVDRYLAIAEALGCFTDEVLFPFPLMKNGVEKLEEIKRSLGDYAVIVPGARWETKIWPAENFGRIASLLSLKTIVVGSGSDRSIADEVVRFSGGKAVSLAGATTLRELIPVMRGAALVISNDTGPMHIAAGANVPVVAIFGPTSPLRSGPYGKGHVVIASDLECSPCFRKKCKNARCMSGITVNSVLDKIVTGVMPRINAENRGSHD
jgi:lipopolysaccharide heptosyltransferase I